MAEFQPNVGDLLDINAERSPHRVALIDPDKHVSLIWSEWKTRVIRFVNSLMEHGIKKGDRVAVILRDEIELPSSFFATSKIGGIFVPLNYRLSPEELRYILDDCAAKVVIFDEEEREAIERIRDKLKYVQTYIYTGEEKPGYAQSFKELTEKGKEIDVKRAASEEDIAMIMYTSGTTGRPKGTVHTHRGVLCASEAWTRPARITPLDRSIALGPLYHIGPLLSNFLPTLCMGGSNVIERQFDAISTLRWVEDFGITVMWATPTHLNMITSLENIKEFNLTNLRAIQYSGAPLSSGLFYKIRDIFGNIDLVNAYGMTELDSVSAIYPEEHDQHLGSVGRALPKTFVRIVEPNTGNPDTEVNKGHVGEIIVRSPCVMKEYWHLPEKTKEVKKGEWYFTGDLGRMDEDGYLYFVEREDDMIISGGENIYPLEVENLLSKHKKVQNVAVIGTPHDTWGEVVTAVIVKADETLTEEEIDEYCVESDELARYKRPKRCIFVDELPTTSSGKVDKKVLRAKWKA
ncbi:MAG: long-chain-fatty-acid--CoA ligase [Deltaproteobacteria bacterium]|nr:MAG: long-chain-fatty-acid--CoA ligase [Deltaproteobacteria bacterium]